MIIRARLAGIRLQKKDYSRLDLAEGYLRLELAEGYLRLELAEGQD